MVQLSLKNYLQLSEFKNREVAFLHKDRILPPKRGYGLQDSNNYSVLEKLLQIGGKEYNSYVTIATYSEVPRFPINPKTHWEQFKEWVKIRDQTITQIDFILDFDTEATINGVKEAWKDVQTSLGLLPQLLGSQAKYVTTWFSGNKGFHILGKMKVTTTAQDLIEAMQSTALSLQVLAPSIDTTIYDTARLRKLLGSTCYSSAFGKTRVIPIFNTGEFEQLIKALESKDEGWFNNKPLVRLNNIKLGQGE